MAKDYAKKYTKYNYLTPKRKNNRYLWLMLGISVGLLALGLFLLKFTHKDRAIPSVEKIVNKKKIGNARAPIPRTKI